MANWSKVGRSSKRKGRNYEHKCSKMLSEFTGVNFRPTPSSGGFNKQGLTIREEMFAGDLISDEENFRFCVEAKNRYNDFSFTALLKNPSTVPFTQWWFQCVDDAKKIDKYPLLIFKPLIRNDFAVFDKSGLNIIGYPQNEPKIVLELYSKSLEIIHPRSKNKIKIKLPTAYMIDWKSLIKIVDSKRFFKN